MTPNYPMFLHANGKLLITGEYLVLKGAKALALPLNKGQSLKVEEKLDDHMHWQSYTSDNELWLDIVFDKDLGVIKSNDEKSAHKLKQILHTAIELNSNVKDHIANTRIKTKLEFNRNWGWGSSSTLIALISKWLNVDPYKLLEASFGGSGYDIACAFNQGPLLYQLTANHPIVELAEFNPSFKSSLYFAYSGKKQNSQLEVGRFNKKPSIDDAVLSRADTITEQMLVATSLNEFGELMKEHESLISSIVHRKMIKDEHFYDFKGYIKSLGAWGGDFFMVASDKDESYIKTYFENKSINTVFRYNEIVLNKN